MTFLSIFFYKIEHVLNREINFEINLQCIKAPFILEINFEINFEIYVNLFLSKEKISSVNSQLSKEINFESVFRNL